MYRSSLLGQGHAPPQETPPNVPARANRAVRCQLRSRRSTGRNAAKHDAAVEPSVGGISHGRRCAILRFPIASQRSPAPLALTQTPQLLAMTARPLRLLHRTGDSSPPRLLDRARNFRARHALPALDLAGPQRRRAGIVGRGSGGGDAVVQHAADALVDADVLGLVDGAGAPGRLQRLLDPPLHRGLGLEREAAGGRSGRRGGRTTAGGGGRRAGVRAVATGRRALGVRPWRWWRADGARAPAGLRPAGHAAAHGRGAGHAGGAGAGVGLRRGAAGRVQVGRGRVDGLDGRRQRRGRAGPAGAVVVVVGRRRGRHGARAGVVRGRGRRGGRGVVRRRVVGGVGEVRKDARPGRSGGLVGRRGRRVDLVEQRLQEARACAGGRGVAARGVRVARGHAARGGRFVGGVRAGLSPVDGAPGLRPLEAAFGVWGRHGLLRRGCIGPFAFSPGVGVRVRGRGGRRFPLARLRARVGLDVARLLKRVPREQLVDGLVLGRVGAGPRCGWRIDKDGGRLLELVRRALLPRDLQPPFPQAATWSLSVARARHTTRWARVEGKVQVEVDRLVDGLPHPRPVRRRHLVAMPLLPQLVARADVRRALRAVVVGRGRPRHGLDGPGRCTVVAEPGPAGDRVQVDAVRVVSPIAAIA